MKLNNYLSPYHFVSILFAYRELNKTSSYNLYCVFVCLNLDSNICLPCVVIFCYVNYCFVYVMLCLHV
jgi:hypothetical protein